MKSSGSRTKPPLGAKLPEERERTVQCVCGRGVMGRKHHKEWDCLLVLSGLKKGEGLILRIKFG